MEINPTLKELVEYWEKSAEHDYGTMLFLYRGKRYSDSLFFGHIVLEKILKAHVVKITSKEAPKIHNLMKLAELAKITDELTEDEKDLLDIASGFNIRSRYPDFKFNFYTYYNNLKNSQDKYEGIKKLYKKLCKKLAQRQKPKK